MADVEIRVEGLKAVDTALKAAEKLDDRKELRAGLKAAAAVVAEDAKGRIPSKTGRARSSVRAAVTGPKAFVVEGKAAVPYVGWLDFGTRNPRTGNPVTVGPWTKSGVGPPRGRFIYPAVDAKAVVVEELVAQAVGKALDDLGF